jgi:hypothetical protein
MAEIVEIKNVSPDERAIGYGVVPTGTGKLVPPGGTAKIYDWALAGYVCQAYWEQVSGPADAVSKKLPKQDEQLKLDPEAPKDGES